MESSVSDSEDQNVPSVSEHASPLNIDSSNTLNIEMNAVNTIDNSAYETESSGYMSDCSEAERTTKRPKGPVASKHRSLNLIQKTMKLKQTKVTKHVNVQSNIDTLQAGENIASRTISSDKKINISVSDDKAVVSVKTDPESLDAKASEMKNLKSQNGCVCNGRVSKELNHECVCGFYKRAMNEVRKFKIPRKKSAQDGSDKKKKKRL